MNIMKRINIKKEHNQYSSVLQVLRLLSYYLNATDQQITQLIFIFLSCPENSRDNKKSSPENSKPHRES